MQVKEIMNPDVMTVSVEESVQECARIMFEQKISGLPVLDAEGRLAGIVTEGDLIRRAAHFKEPGFLPLLGGLIFLDDPNRFLGELRRAMATHVGRLMSRELFTVGPEETLEQAATLMLRRQVKRLPVVDAKGHLVGILSRRDLIRELYPVEEGSHA
jgi:CBS domain-containing protein